MTTATTERQELHQAIERLPDSAISQIKGYVARVYEEMLEELEEAEDIAYIKALPRSEYENAVPESEIIADYEAKYGALD
jgi:hypothetical protein